MTETNTSPMSAEKVNAEQYKNLIMILTVLTTVLAAVLAALQADAGIHADMANRDSQYLAIQASGELHRAGIESNYEFTIFGDYLKNLQEATILELTALEQEENGNNASAQTSRELAAIAQTRADLGEKFSILYTDPRYAPQVDGDMPKADQYILDLNEQANTLVARQNEAADAYSLWNSKADSYVTALTILAVAFFLFGLAQAVKIGRMRLAFTGLGALVILFSLAMTVLTVLG